MTYIQTPAASVFHTPEVSWRSSVRHRHRWLPKSSYYYYHICSYRTLTVSSVSVMPAMCLMGVTWSKTGRLHIQMRLWCTSRIRLLLFCMLATQIHQKAMRYSISCAFAGVALWIHKHLLPWWGLTAAGCRLWDRLKINSSVRDQLLQRCASLKKGRSHWGQGRNIWGFGCTGTTLHWIFWQ